MGYESKRGLLLGLDQIANSPGVQQGGSPLGGLLGANQLKGGVSLNPDGTVGTVSPVSPAHHVLDAIFNHSNALRLAQQQNAAMQERALATTQGITSGHAATADVMAAQQQRIDSARAQAIQQAGIEAAKAAGIAMYDDNGQPSKAYQALTSSLDPKKIEAQTQAIAQRQTINQNPDVQKARTGEAIAQAQSQGVANMKNSQMTAGPGAASVQLNPTNPGQVMDTVVGGSPSSSSSTTPNIINSGGFPLHVGDIQRSQSGMTPGGVTQMPIPHDIRQILGDPSVGSISDPGASAAEQEQANQGDTQSSIAAPASTGTNWGKIAGGAADAIKAALASKQSAPVDMSTANNLIQAGGQQALNPTTIAATPQLQGGMNTFADPFAGSTTPRAPDVLPPSGQINDPSVLQQIQQLLMRNNIRDI